MSVPTVAEMKQMDARIELCFVTCELTESVENCGFRWNSKKKVWQLPVTHYIDGDWFSNDRLMCSDIQLRGWEDQGINVEVPVEFFLEAPEE